MRVSCRRGSCVRDDGMATIFGPIGDANTFHVATFHVAGVIQSEDGTFEGAVSEGGVVSMADGYAGCPVASGVSAVAHGPCAANTINALVVTVCAGSPLFLVVSDAPAKRARPQQIELPALFRTVGTESHRVTSAEHVVVNVAITFARAAVMKSIVVLDIPAGLRSKEIHYWPSQRPGSGETMSWGSRSRTRSRLRRDMELRGS